MQPIGSIKVEVESGPNSDKVEGVNPPHIIDTDVKVIKYGGQVVGISKSSTDSVTIHIYLSKNLAQVEIICTCLCLSRC